MVWKNPAFYIRGSSARARASGTGCGNASVRDDSSAFDVTLARRKQTLRIGVGVSLLDSLRKAGVDLPSS